ncbi:MAG: hypothetical protein AB7V18_20080 [Pyrinomonadaceae bacterium]
MMRIALGVFVGFLAWVVVWFGSETILSAVWPAFGSHQTAFQTAIEQGGPFTANATFLLVHIVLATIVSVIAGYLAALVAGENKRSALILGLLLLAVGLLKAIMSWPLVPVWYHVIFTAILLPMAILGGKLKAANS